MPYTLMKGLVWVLLAVLLGIIIGWLLRSVAAKRQVERARAANVGMSDQQELERLRNRIANLEPVVAERDRLRAELDEERTRSAPSSTTTSGEASADVSPDGAPVEGPTATDGTNAIGAAAVLGRPVEADDLTAIEGIGPQIAELCHGIGIRTWAELSVTEVSLLRTMLNDAGQRFKAHDPSTWPRQAALLASGDWAEFAALTGGADGERPVD